MEKLTYKGVVVNNTGQHFVQFQRRANRNISGCSGAEGYHADVYVGDFLSHKYLLNRIEYKNSISDPNWHSQKTATMRYKKAKKIDLNVYLRVPVKPVFKPPKRFPKFARPLRVDYIVPVRVPKPLLQGAAETPFHFETRKRIQLERWYQQDLSKQRRMLELFYERTRRYDSLAKSLESHYQDYLKTYLKRLSKYEWLLLRLERRREIVKTWQSRRSTRFFRPAGVLPDHPYTREIFYAADGSDITFNKWYRYGWNHVLDMYNTGPTNNAYYGTNVFETYGPNSYVYGLGWVEVGFPSGSIREDLIKASIQDEQTFIDYLLDEEIRRLDDKQLVKLHGKIKNQDLHIANIVAERAQTLSMFRDACERLLEIASGKKRIAAALGAFLSNPRKIANDFLAFKFGVEPLLSDVYSLGQKLGEYDVGIKDSFSIRVNGTDNIDKVVSDAFGTYRIVGSMEISYSVKLSITDNLLRQLGTLGLVNPAEIAWEMMPWSFVIDWFLPVGKWIGNLTSFVGLEITSGTRKIKMTYTKTRLSPVPNTPQVLICWSGGNTTCGSIESDYLRESKRRTVFTSLPELELPRVKNPFSWTHNLEALALVCQKLFK